ncbi:MAG TPA: hypothetical protein VJ934_00125, partial [Desulfomicrobiaceae bacterium]|nr:hypothetical protein [Desulfomicrobiaceae bacterium]
SLVPEQIVQEITEQDRDRLFAVTSTDLNDAQRTRLTTPARTHPLQREVLAVHWHPEFVPMDINRQRIEATFPKKEQELIIPTQHNEILTYDDYAGVEVDCFSHGFNQKVQLLLHFRKENVEDASVLRAMLAHTYQYRASQLFEFMHTVTRPRADRLDEAARETGAGEDIVMFVQTYVRKIQDLLEKHLDDLPRGTVKNKLLRNYFDAMRPEFGDPLIDRCQTFLTAVKKIVKRHFSFKYFYRTSEIIEEARSLGAGIVIPHPEQFWPILLADYDVDGYEVWNPQSLRYTEFLISAVDRRNRCRGSLSRPLLVFMGDDTHMGEKVKDPADQKKEKGSREIGIQPPWENLQLRKKLILSNMTRDRVINEYKARLGG